MGSVDVGVDSVSVAVAAILRAVPGAAAVASRGTPAGPAAGTGYTIAHAGRQIRFGPVVFWIVVGTVVIMAGWSVATATYFAFRDDVLKGLIAPPGRAAIRL